MPRPIYFESDSVLDFFATMKKTICDYKGSIMHYDIACKDAKWKENVTIQLVV